MKRQESKKPRRLVIPIWTFDQAKQALPYITSIMQSLREHRLEARTQQRQAERLVAKYGKPDRRDLITHQETLREAQRAEDRYQDSLHELQELGVYCQNSIRGLALIPFVHEHLLAWFVFDMFADQPLDSWRYHNDPEETRRPLSELEQKTAIA